MGSLTPILAIDTASAFFFLLGLCAAGWCIYKATKAFQDGRTSQGIGWLAFTPIAFFLGLFSLVILVVVALLLIASLFIGENNVVDSRWGQKVGDIKSSWDGKERHVRRGNLGDLNITDETGRREAVVHPGRAPRSFGGKSTITDDAGTPIGGIRPTIGGNAEITDDAAGRVGNIRPHVFGGAKADITNGVGGKEAEIKGSGFRAKTRKKNLKKMMGRTK